MSGQSAGHLQRCLLLHRRDFSNTSLLVEVFSATEGRFPAVAKGARRGRAPTAALLQPFQPLWLGWSGRGEVRTLGKVEAAGAPLTLPGDALYCGFYLNELLMRLLARHDPQENLFAFYLAALKDLASGQVIDQVLRRFELQLLQVLGYGLVLDREADTGHPISAAGRYRYVPERGIVPARDAMPQETLSGTTLLQLAGEEPLGGKEIREARRLLRAALAPHLGQRPLASREFFRRARGS
ncbi:DNA repair protein RecO [Thioflavicoccus mobilis 8321]|uniref:DNA repair protein RecO n=1 Tax=Thioflavicoccus mobilis 8321 TaxID=765912 RepID=L0GYZ1_9GAMM|nr:DNA repair protein RecO [Thioflavicoccus mobilis]AGA90600.1 DNA repair protein RecO [Thioflavicoccus mobilis 8321]